MRCSKTGRVLELVSAERPYQLWSGDEWKCPVCEARVIAGYGQAAMVEGFDEDRYAKMKEYEENEKNVVSIVV
jgi:hypothetical protein